MSDQSLETNAPLAAAIAGAPPRPLSLAPPWRGLRRPLPHPDPSVAVAAAILGVVALWVLFPAWLAPYSPVHLDVGAVMAPPGAAHWLGTDNFGRDVLSLLIGGARQSLLVGVAAVMVGAVIGSAVGLVVGYAGGLVDTVVMRLLEIWMAIPEILLVILIATALKPSVPNLILTIGIVSVPRYIRVMRSQVIAVKNQPFVEASRALGASHASVLARHIVPHTLSLLLVMVTLGVGSAMLMGAALSFLGLGLVQDQPDWGALISQGRSYLTAACWLVVFPSLAVTAVVIALNLLGESLRVRFDPRSQLR